MPEEAQPDLTAIAEPEIHETANGAEEAEREREDLDARAKAENVKRLRFENKQTKQDRKERRKYAHRIFCMICCWLSSMGLLVVFQGFSLWSFRLESGVLITAISTTTGSVIAVFLIVANYLFPKPKR